MTPPSCSAIPPVQFDEDSSYTSLDLDSYVVDVDDGPETLNWTFHGQVHLIITIHPTTHVVTFSALADWFGNETVVFRVTDPHGSFEEVPVSVTVRPVPETYALSVTVTPVGSGIVALDPPSGIYEEGTVVSVEATAAEGWEFDHWEDDLTGLQNPTSLLMDSDRSLTAVFGQTGGEGEGEGEGETNRGGCAGVSGTPPSGPLGKNAASLLIHIAAVVAFLTASTRMQNRPDLRRGFDPTNRAR